MKYNDIILFRFNKELDTTLKSLSILKRQNPDLRIYGLNGANKDRPDQQLTPAYLKEFNKYLEHIYYIKHDDWEWKWKNGDLAIREWYQDYGHKLKFERMSWTEWDVINIDKIQNCYKHIPREKKSIAVTGFATLENIEKHCAPNYQWLYRDEYKQQFINLQKHLMEKYNHIHLKYTCCFPTGYFTKEFLDDYASIEVSEDSHDEMRVPAYAEILGYTIYDTGFTRDRFDPKEEKFYNTWAQPVTAATILKELKKDKRIQRKVFHPVRNISDVEKIEKALFGSVLPTPMKAPKYVPSTVKAKAKKEILVAGA